jgi:hypothetical protein
MDYYVKVWSLCIHIPTIYIKTTAIIPSAASIPSRNNPLFPSTLREGMEAALGIIAVVLMYIVGIWMHRRSSAKRWKSANARLKIKPNIAPPMTLVVPLVSLTFLVIVVNVNMLYSSTRK